MIGLKRLDNIQFCVRVYSRPLPRRPYRDRSVARRSVDLYMRCDPGGLQVKRSTYLQIADSFEGLPHLPMRRLILRIKRMSSIAFGRSLYPKEVEQNFRKYDLLDDQVHFLKGVVQRCACRSQPIEKLAGDAAGRRSPTSPHDGRS